MEMKKMLAVLLPLMFSAAATLAWGAEDSVVRWNSIVGIITAPAVDNPVGSIHGGAGPWSVRSGHARVDLSSGAAFFDVEGLVLNGGNSSGTPGPVTAVTGTLVCNPGPTATVHDTAEVALNVHGDAHFAGQISGIPASCGNPLFLLRIAQLTGANGRWIATGTERLIGSGQ